MLSLIEQLRRIGGVGSEVDKFSIALDGQEIRVEYCGGSSSSLELLAPYPEHAAYPAAPAYRALAAQVLAAPRPINVRLRREHDADRAAKAEGVAVEVQTGDRDFDDTIYVDSPSERRVVEGVLATDEVRAAALAIIEDGATLVIDNEAGLIVATLASFTERHPNQQRGARLVRAFADLLRALPRVRTTGRTPGDPWTALTTVAGAIAAVGLAGSAATYMGAAPTRCVTPTDGGWNLECGAGADCCWPAAAGIVGGLLLGVIPVAVLGRVVRGRSDSPQTATWLKLLALLIAVELGIVVARLAWR